MIRANLQTILLVFVLMMPMVSTAMAQQAAPNLAERRVVVNGTRLASDFVHALEQRYRVRILDGRYWYDRASGAWGFADGPTVGFIPAGLALGGPLPADASAGTTGVFVNGRQLPVEDVRALHRIVGAVIPGRYWMDARGNVGREDGPAFLNLPAMARQAGIGRGNTFYRSGTTGIGAGSSGGASYVMGKDWSVIVE